MKSQSDMDTAGYSWADQRLTRLPEFLSHQTLVVISLAGRPKAIHVRAMALGVVTNGLWLRTASRAVARLGRT